MSAVNIINIELPKEQYKNKCPYEMKPIGITVHETDNNASARDEISYMQRNTNEVSFHFAVDEKEIIQGLPLDRNGWHAGDGGSGKGNRTTIAVEICRNHRTDDLTNYYMARKNAEKLVGYLLRTYGWTDKDIYTHNHWSGKNCPRVIIKEGYLQTFKDNATKLRETSTMVDSEPIEEPTPKPLKSVAEIAQEVLSGKWGNGTFRTNALKNAGYDPAVVQKRVNDLANEKLNKKSNEVIAKEVVDGKWGNGDARRKSLTKAGYNPSTIQQLVNELVGKPVTKPKMKPSTKPGARVRTNATKDVNGTSLSKNAINSSKLFTVLQENSKAVLLKEVMTWVSKDSLV